MQTQTYSVYSVISTKIPIPKYIEIGMLIGRDGRNLKPIADETGTYIHVNKTTNPARIQIKINQLSNASDLSPKNRINEAVNQLENLMKELKEKRNRSLKNVENRINEEKDQLDDLVKEPKKERNRRKVPLKKKENDIGFLRSDDDRHATSRYLKGIESKKERKYSKREINEHINYTKIFQTYLSC